MSKFCLNPVSALQVESPSQTEPPLSTLRSALLMKAPIEMHYGLNFSPYTKTLI